MSTDAAEQAKAEEGAREVAVSHGARGATRTESDTMGGIEVAREV